MVLVDTSVWIDYLRAGDSQLARLLEINEVLMHPFVIGELACENLRNRKTVLSLLHDLPATLVASDREVMVFIENHALMGQGLGFVDAHLLAATALNDSARLWTRDRALMAKAVDLNLSWSAVDCLPHCFGLCWMSPGFPVARISIPAPGMASTTTPVLRVTTRLLQNWLGSAKRARRNSPSFQTAARRVWNP